MATKRGTFFQLTDEERARLAAQSTSSKWRGLTGGLRAALDKAELLDKARVALQALVDATNLPEDDDGYMDQVCIAAMKAESVLAKLEEV